MTDDGLAIDVLLCTYRRPQVAATLRSLLAQEVPAGVRLRIIVADNDDPPTAAPVVQAIAADAPVEVCYIHAPKSNISVARNACLDRAEADWLAFLDDDEIAPPGWIAALLRAAQASGANAVFGPSVALYPPQAPGWMRGQDHHSNHPVRRNGAVQTGHTCNALLRWRGTVWTDQRFDDARGRTGGEDTAFFFALARRGAVFADAPEAAVHEEVPQARLRFGWLLRRKFRMGQSYVCAADGPGEIAALALGAVGKSAVCGVMAALPARDLGRAQFWALRGAFHAGVVAGALRLPQPRIYGG